MMTKHEIPKRRILIIDDEVGMTALGRRILEVTGEFSVREENDVTQALATSRAFLPHLILLDLHLPGKSGREIAGQLAADSALSAIPVVFLTGDLDAAGSCDGHPVLLKPVRALDLVGTCRAWALDVG
jgi:CheY-like chemotaxis protein